MATEEQVMDALREVYDPEIPINVVDLGLIYGIDIQDSSVHVKMTMTMRGCPLYGVMMAQAKAKVEALDGVEAANVELVWDPPWTPDRISPELRRRMSGGS